MPILHAIVLGIVQGLSEFLPISSSGHLLLTPWAFGWHDFAGSADLEKTFDVALHLGTLIGAIAYFRADIVTLVRAAFFPARVPATVTSGTLAADNPTPDTERRLAWLLLLSCIPGGVTGALLETPIEDHLGQIWLIGDHADRLRARSSIGPTTSPATAMSPTSVCVTRCSWAVDRPSPSRRACRGRASRSASAASSASTATPPLGCRS